MVLIEHRGRRPSFGRTRSSGLTSRFKTGALTSYREYEAGSVRLAILAVSVRGPPAMALRQVLLGIARQEGSRAPSR